MWLGGLVEAGLQGRTTVGLGSIRKTGLSIRRFVMQIHWLAVQGRFREVW